ncbi:hypothetical protein BKA65DRAFT_478544 [Rhexocercosporidium sp. MPI-PUGE-AT-0058]|nr:hypothetical protein BKA65DRAFT_478544 [Rhexocercosporidium sp. MPI-PUGE-AT-0058]
MAPGPFCCHSAIPSTLRYITHLLPNTTTHNPLSPTKDSAPLLMSFLAHLITNSVPLPTTIPEGASPLFYAIIQVKKTNPLDQTGEVTGTATAESKSKPRPNAKTGPSSSAWIVTSPAPTPTAQHLSSRLSTSKTTSPTRRASERYFVPIEKSTAPTALAQNSLLFGKDFREIEHKEAMESLRFPETGIVIGDGEVWTEQEGVERFWCEGHRLWFELRVWIREGMP